MAVQRATIGPDGEGEVVDMPSSKNFQSSEDYQQGGIKATKAGGFHTTVVADPSQLGDDDLVKLGEMELKVRDAKAMGLMGDIIQAAQQQATHMPSPREQQQQSAPQDESTGNPTFDQAREALNEAIEAGTITFEEASTYDAVNSSLAITNTTPEEAWDLLADLSEGKLSEADVDPEKLGVVHRAYTEMFEAARVSARGELGDTAADELANLAESHPGVMAVLHRFAFDRSQGITNLRWNDIHAHIRSELGMR